MKKWKVLLILGIICAVVLGVDLVKMNTVTLTVESVTPEPAAADPDEPVTIDVTLRSKSGQPIADHNLYALTLSGGSFLSYRQKTDANGRAIFVYFPYKVASYQTVRDVTIQIRDESNSVFVEMYPTVEYEIKMQRPDESDDEGGLTIDDIIGN